MKPSELRFLKNCRYMLLPYGIWPLESKNKWKQIFYKIHFTVNYWFFVWYNISRFLAALILCSKGHLKAAARSMSYSTEMAMSVLKCNVCMSQRLQEIIQIVCEIEEDIFLSGDATVISIYEFYIKRATNVGMGYILFCNAATASFMGGSFFSSPQEDSSGSEEVITNPFLDSWAPFDKEKYLLLGYAYDFYGVCVAFGYIVFTGIFFFSLFSFFIANAKILQHYLKNMKSYILKIREEQGVAMEEAEMIFLLKCIKRHRDLIRFMDNLDKQMNFYAFMEFLSASVKLCFLLIQINPGTTPLYELFATCIFITSTTVELSIYYWFGNEIILESTALSDSIFGSHFYELSNPTQKNLLFMILRSRRPCKLSIGPFYVMCVETLITIIRSGYALLCLINNFASKTE